MKRPRIILQKHPTDMMLDVTVCRNCGHAVLYGNLINNTGHDACPDCYPSLAAHIKRIRDTDYETYRTSDHLYILNDEKYQAAVQKLQKKYKKEG